VVTVLDRYGHLLPMDDDPVTDALDELAKAAKPKLADGSCDWCAISGGAHWREMGSDLRGRGGTRTPDICLVRAAL
jgi:hypothetical protein